MARGAHLKARRQAKRDMTRVQAAAWVASAQEQVQQGMAIEDHIMEDSGDISFESARVEELLGKDMAEVLRRLTPRQVFILSCLDGLTITEMTYEIHAYLQEDKSDLIALGCMAKRNGSFMATNKMVELAKAVRAAEAVLREERALARS